MTGRAVMNRHKFCGSTDFVDCSVFGFLVRLMFDRMSGQQNYLDEAQKPFALTDIAGNWSDRELKQNFCVTSSAIF